MGRSRFILIVEDNADDVDLARRAIKKLDATLKVAVAKDGAEAIDVCCGGGLAGEKLPALVLLDLKLPKYGGEEVFHCLRSKDSTKHLPIILVSASKEDISRLRVEDIGAVGYLAKPLTAADLSDFILRYAQEPRKL